MLETMVSVKKKRFLRQVAEILREAELNVVDLILKDDETVLILYENSYIKPVCIAADSPGAMILDITRAAMY